MAQFLSQAAFSGPTRVCGDSRPTHPFPRHFDCSFWSFLDPKSDIINSVCVFCGKSDISSVCVRYCASTFYSEITFYMDINGDPINITSPTPLPHFPISVPCSLWARILISLNDCFTSVCKRKSAMCHRHFHGHFTEVTNWLTCVRMQR